MTDALNVRASSEKLNFTKHLVGFWRDLEGYPINQSPRFRRILIPIDATQVKSGDLKPVLEVAQRLDAELTLLHCYEIPLSFHYAVGRSALMEVVLHRDLVRTQLLQLCAEVRKFFASCRSEFTVGSLPVEILSRESEATK